MSGHQRLTLTRRYSDALESFAPLLAPERVHRLSHAPYVSLYRSSRGENAAYIELVGRWRGERSNRSFKLRLDGNRQANENTPAAIAKGLATATPVDLAATLHENHHALLRGSCPISPACRGARGLRPSGDSPCLVPSPWSTFRKSRRPRKQPNDERRGASKCTAGGSDSPPDSTGGRVSQSSVPNNPDVRVRSLARASPSNALAAPAGSIPAGPSDERGNQ
jgi:hypothetical protein